MTKASQCSDGKHQLDVRNQKQWKEIIIIIVIIATDMLFKWFVNNLTAKEWVVKETTLHLKPRMYIFKG